MSLASRDNQTLVRPTEYLVSDTMKCVCVNVWEIKQTMCHLLAVSHLGATKRTFNDKAK